VRLEDLLEVAALPATGEAEQAGLETRHATALGHEREDREHQEHRQHHDRQAKIRRDERVEVDFRSPPRFGRVYQGVECVRPPLACGTGAT
jgi:hypothetical protein